MIERRLYFNGIDPQGRYLTPSMAAGEMVERLPLVSVDRRLLQWVRERTARGIFPIGRPWDLAETGWAVIFAPGLDPRVRFALRALLEHRRAQATRNFSHFYQELEYLPGESTFHFLSRHGVFPGSPVDPDRLPYHILLVGDPEDLPYIFQAELDITHGVGRICFDQIEDYETYARSVVRAEIQRPGRPRDVVFFGPQNAQDPVTRGSARELLEPLLGTLAHSGMGWRIRSAIGEEASKEKLRHLLGGSETPDILFAAGHGLGIPAEDERQREAQGALVCQDWPGPDHQGAVGEDEYFDAQDLSAEASLHGLVAFLVASYGVGTSAMDGFNREPFGLLKRVAPQAFAARLPQRLLAHPRGGALAVVGYVDQAGATSHVAYEAFASTLQSLLAGHTIGWATKYLNQSYARVAMQLADLLEERPSEAVDEELLSTLWEGHNSLRNLSVFGDPAVRLPGSAGMDIQVQEIKGTTNVRGAGGDPWLSIATSPRRRGSGGGVDVSDSAGGDPTRIPGVDLSPPKGRPPISREKPPPLGGFKFSSYTPSEIRPEEWKTLFAYGFQEGFAQAVAEDSSRRLGTKSERYLQAQASASQVIATGSEVVIVPELAGCRFNPPQASFSWFEDWHCAELRFQAVPGRPGFAPENDLLGRLSFYVNAVLVADLSFNVRLTLSFQAKPAGWDFRRTEAKPYQSVFISYAHSDAVVVETLEEAYAALGVSPLRDIRFLRPGEEWEPKLLEKIDEADVFQLFWSNHARKSKWVKAEWQHALALERPFFVRPVYWETPMPKPPKELTSLHFHHLRLDR